MLGGSQAMTGYAALLASLRTQIREVFAYAEYRNARRMAEEQNAIIVVVLGAVLEIMITRLQNPSMNMKKKKRKKKKNRLE